MEAIIGGVVALIGALVGSGQDAQAQAIREQLAAEFEDIDLPMIDKLVAQKLPPDAAARYMKSTQATQAQSDVLGKTMEVVNEKGETADDRAAYLRMRNAAGGIAASAESNVHRDMARRGLENSGMAFAMRQSGAQSAANAANRAGTMEASDARGRYMDALGMAGGMSSSMRSQDFAAMQAQDAINMFNARQQSDADMRNQQIPQQQFDNRMTKMAGKSNAQNAVAAGYERGAQATRETAGGVGQSIITAGAAYRQNGSKRRKYVEDAGGEYADGSGGQDW
jgi:hypothetical protein